MERVLTFGASVDAAPTSPPMALMVITLTSSLGGGPIVIGYNLNVTYSVEIVSSCSLGRVVQVVGFVVQVFQDSSTRLAPSDWILGFCFLW